MPPIIALHQFGKREGHLRKDLGCAILRIGARQSAIRLWRAMIASAG